MNICTQTEPVTVNTVLYHGTQNYPVILLHYNMSPGHLKYHLAKWHLTPLNSRDNNYTVLLCNDYVEQSKCCKYG